ncbi:Phosphoserine phosphatase SerB [Methanonatronarchaeum thermophilum]|uniref:phosphoserine phosphatase n=1 Tax=Methanonatronarchaeum thermophilum TaxID=1927129 RepID=A0A1Y3GEU8_9EURY|nr:bifunctional phosphoserine phosphatase/homoserine phosphotransferase ThrH [Methanonatronarchaeum thermophilum]OUJ18714.1 Phosphoserine phosphatase SerB [Methanonatronarchaeum thermophilum]
MNIICLDLESILIPEIWEEVAEETGIEELELTTRDIKDYNELMAHRYQVLRENKIDLQYIKKVIKTIEPLEGAPEFVKWARNNAQVAILTDSFYEFINPIMEEFNKPMVFARTLKWDEQGYLDGYTPPKNIDIKLTAIKTFNKINLNTIAVGDSFNDLTMLREANKGYLYKPSKDVKQNVDDIEKKHNYQELKQAIKKQL